MYILLITHLIKGCTFLPVQPKVFRQLRADLASMWIPSNKGNLRRISAKSNGVVHFQECEQSGDLDEENTSMKVLHLDAIECSFSTFIVLA